MAELAFGITETVLEKLASKAYEEISLAKSAKDNLKKLHETTLILKSVLKDAEKKQNQKQNEGLRIWLVKLKDVLNDAVDVLDEFDCEVLRRQVVKDYGTTERKVRRFCSRSNPLAFRFSIAHRIEKIKERFDEITKEMSQFQLISSQLDGHGEKSHPGDLERSGRMTHSFVKGSEVIGRDGDKVEMLDRLMHQDGCDGDNNLSLVPIVGLGDLGKTTVAKLVFNDEKVKGMFELMLWVCVSSDFNVLRLLREILKSATNAEQDSSLLSLDQVQTSVRTALEGKKFLLVLDDVWNNDRVKWLELRQFLTGGAQGSTVIVTTRSTTVSAIMTKATPHKLQGLSKEDSLSLFFRCSFGDEKLAGQNPRLEDIGQEIVKKCGGVPLALKTLGSLLYSKPEAKWISVRDNEIWEMEEEDDRILPALQMSYDYMSSSMKQCFAYCSTFPEDADLNSFYLTLIWMALGFLQSPNGKFELEDVGRLQFKELCDRSFLQRIDDRYFGSDEDDGDEKEENMYGFFHRCNMHDLIHDLARSITKSECCIVKSGEEDISESMRNLRLFYNQNSPKIVKRLKRLRSIHVDHTSEEQDISESFLSLCITQLRYLRVFDLNDLSFEVLPSSVGTLKHLRYLNLSENKTIKRLPDSICKLQSLQTLLLHYCDELEELPMELRNLVSLTVLSITTKQTHFQEGGIGCLKSLQRLLIVYCNNLRSLPNDMKHCTNLRHLFIENCKELDLASREYIVIPLSLQTFHITLLPHTTALPHWLRGASHTLKKLAVRQCDELLALPEWLQDFTSLDRLVIKGCQEILSLPDCPTSLTHLEIEDCGKLDLASTHDGLFNLKLKMFRINYLPETTALPSWLQGASHTLEYLRINWCDRLSALPEWLSDLTSLKRLEIDDCRRLSTLPEGMSRLKSLTHLTITDCSSAFVERYAPETGEDWQSIAHVPNVKIQ